MKMLLLTKEPFLGACSRDILRFQWHRGTRDYLASEGIVTEDHGFGSRRRRSSGHKSALVRAYASRGDVLNNAEDIFLATYLFRRPEAGGIDIPHQVKSFQDALNREKLSDKEVHDV